MSDARQEAIERMYQELPQGPLDREDLAGLLETSGLLDRIAELEAQLDRLGRGTSPAAAEKFKKRIERLEAALGTFFATAHIEVRTDVTHEIVVMTDVLEAVRAALAQSSPTPQEGSA